MRRFAVLALVAGVLAATVSIAGAQSRDGGATRLTPPAPAQHYANRIEGIVKDSSGRAVSNIPVTLMRRIDVESRPFLAADHLIPADIRLRSITDARGAFSFNDRQPGTYYI